MFAHEMEEPGMTTPIASGAAFEVFDNVVSSEFNPFAAPHPDGTLIVVALAQDTGTIEVRQIDANGQALNGFNVDVSGPVGEPAVAVLQNGSIVVSWHDSSTLSVGFHVYTVPER
jgi:hypothetical protein